MAAPKYKQYVQKMIDDHEAVFAKFRPIHDGYKVEPREWSAQFHEVGRDVMDLARDYERRLCSGMERGKNSVFSAKVAEKFWAELRLHFSHIERVGVKSSFDK